MSPGLPKYTTLLYLGQFKLVDPLDIMNGVFCVPFYAKINQFNYLSFNGYPYYPSLPNDILLHTHMHYQWHLDFFLHLLSFILFSGIMTLCILCSLPLLWPLHLFSLFLQMFVYTRPRQFPVSASPDCHGLPGSHADLACRAAHSYKLYRFNQHPDWGKEFWNWRALGLIIINKTGAHILLSPSSSSTHLSFINVKKIRLAGERFRKNHPSQMKLNNRTVLCLRSVGKNSRWQPKTLSYFEPVYSRLLREPPVRLWNLPVLSRGPSSPKQLGAHPYSLLHYRRLLHHLQSHFFGFKWSYNSMSLQGLKVLLSLRVLALKTSVRLRND